MDNNLFNEATIKRMVAESGISPNKKQIKASKDWIELLEREELKEEVSNYPRFMEHILRNLLGYDTVNFNHEEGNMEFPFRDSSGEYLVVFEAKGTKTKDLEAPQGRNLETRKTPVRQIWDYMGRDVIPWGILTNYKKFVLFDRDKSYNDYYEFNFLDIKNNSEKLKEFIKIFSRESLENNFIEKLKKASEIEEKELSGHFYKIYHETRLMMLKEFMENGRSKNEALHYTQLYLNRLMFVFFAEDLGFIKKRIFEEIIIKALNNCSDNSSHVSDEIMVLFEDLDKGSPKKEIQQFNGGLFKENLSRDAYFKDLRNSSFFKGIYFEKKKLDDRLKLTEDEMKIFNKVKKEGLSPIIENILLMASYDFKSELKVNVLGHIFEQSLSDLEELKGENISKRKKEGIFYTPEYITDYICRNTIIPYLSKSGTNDIDKLIDEYSKDLEVLEEKFKNIKILDPACGSGAFLIKAIDVLFEIFKGIQDVKDLEDKYSAKRGLKAKSNIQGQFTLTKWDEKDEIRKIIGNNIFGVDLNEESIETTKLSLFLRIAKKGKKLPDLSDNIKCGNSLIDDKEVAGELAFDWSDKEKGFGKIMDNGGFDVVVGNPPYGAKLNEEEVKFVKNNYSVGNSETAQLMMEKAHFLLKDNGYHSFIIPKAFTFVSTWDRIRNKFLDELNILIDCKKVWREVKLEQIIYIIQKGNKFDKYYSGIRDNNSIKIIARVNKSLIPKFDGVLLNSLTNQEIQIGSKIKDIETTLGTMGINKWGDVFYQQINKEKSGFNVLGGSEIQRYYRRGIKGYIENKYIKSNQSLIKPNSVLLQRIIAHIENPIDHLKISGTIFEDSSYRIVNTVHQLILDKEISNKYVLAIINSNFMNWFVYRFVFAKAIRSFQFSGDVAKKIPIPKLSGEEQKPFIEKAEKMLELNKEFYEKKDKFLTMLKSDFGLEKVSKNLQGFYELDWKGFEIELGKKKIALSGNKKDDWFDRFNGMSREVRKLRDEIDKTDDEINKMVYGLYGLSEGEVGVVEESWK